MGRGTRRAVCVAAVAVAGLVPAAAAAAPVSGSEDAAAADYRALLEHHTRWAETTWDPAAGSYQAADFNFVNVLGNAVLLELGDYDAQATGVERDVLEDHTVRTIRRFAASNRWVDPDGDWGAQLFWDSTFESYFVAAAKLMWDELDATTHANVDRIVQGEADYVVSLGTNEDPRSGGWSSNGLTGGWQGDTKMEEMGVKTMPLALALAYEPQAAAAPQWRTWLDRWHLNMTGLPAADQANPALVDGRPIAEWNTAHNFYDVFLTENHGSVAPMYQESAGAYPGRNVAQFVIAGRPVPEALRSGPSARELGATLERIGTDAGVAEDFMVADRHHLYGRNALPIAYRAVVLGDPYAARSERMLLDHLEPYQAYPPADRLTKFSGEPKYEPEARAETAMAYLLHYARVQLGGGAEPIDVDQYWAGRSGATDYGADLGLAAQQSPRTLAAAVTKAGFTKFAFLPQHDDWLFDVSGASPALLPSTALTLTGRTTHVYRGVRDGYDATATVVTTDGGAAGYATLPGGEAVYATTGLGADEGALRVTNLDMPGVDGLDGDRTYTAADGSVTLTGGLGDGGVDDVRFDPVTARHVRFLGVQPATQYGYSLYGLEVRDGAGADLAQGQPATASSYDPTAPGPFPPQAATDGDPATRWAVSKGERGRGDSWLAVDLGHAQRFDHVVLSFESAYGARYRVQVSDDGQTWRDVAVVPAERRFSSPWLNVDGRAGFVVRGSENPIAVTATSATLSAGPAEGARGMVVEARPAETPQETAAAAAAPAPSAEGVLASRAGGMLTLFNLGASDVAGAAVTLPGTRLYRGTQTVTDAGTVYAADLAAHDARVEAPRFEVQARHGGRGIGSLRATVADSHHVTIANVAGRGVAQLTVRSVATGERRQVTVPAGREKAVAFHDGPLQPTANLATTRITYPTSPLPAGMSDPDLAVDGDPATGWRPGTGGRMVVDLGASRVLGAAVLHWAGPAPRAEISVSEDGVTYHPVAAGGARIDLGGAAGRWVAIRVTGGPGGELRELGLYAPGTDEAGAGA